MGEEEQVNPKNFIDTLYMVSSLGYNNLASGNQDYGTVNELSEEDLRKRRNRQLIFSLIVIAVIVSGILIYKAKKK